MNGGSSMYRASALLALVALLAGCSSQGSTGLTPPAQMPAAIRPAAAPVVGGCQIFPVPSGKPTGNDWWNTDISKYPLDPNSANYIKSIPGNLHPDFGHETFYGIPFDIVPSTQKKVPVSFDYAS